MSVPPAEFPYVSGLEGAFAPLLSPFDSGDQALDSGALRQHLEFLAASGLQGLLLMGTNGEFAFLGDSEKMEIISLVKAAGHDLHLIIGATVPDSPSRSVEFAGRAASAAPAGSHLLMAPPFYHRYARGEEVNEDETVQFYANLLNAHLGAELLAYNVPVPPRGPVTSPVTPDIVRSLAGYDGLAGVKDSSGNVEAVAAYRAANPGLQVLVGNDNALSGGLDRGAAGSITACANVFPAAVLRVYRCESPSERELAQQELSLLRGILESVQGKMVAIQKYLLQRLGIVNRLSPVRIPGGELTGAEVSTLMRAAREAGRQLKLNDDLGGQLLEFTSAET